MQANDISYYCVNCGKKDTISFKNDISSKHQLFNHIIRYGSFYCSQDCEKEFRDGVYNRLSTE